MTWEATSAPMNNLWQWVACSADGTNMMGASFVSGSRDPRLTFFRSTNAGATWTQAAAPATNVTAVGISADRSRLMAFGYPNVYTSTDWGTTWIQAGAPLNVPDGSVPDGQTIVINSITCSSDGTKLTVAGPVGIFISTNSGAKWMQTDVPGEPWQAVTCSADGNKLVAASYPDPSIYTLQLPLQPSTPLPSPNLKIGTTVGDVGLSWLVPSSGFVLQENCDLTTTNWMDMQTTPSLNFTNLNYQVNRDSGAELASELC